MNDAAEKVVNWPLKCCCQLILPLLPTDFARYISEMIFRHPRPCAEDLPTY